eukprot:TRINITY_DN7168_c0_g1_i1.p1 TRINITY_DN7168_c0_g1~~TRINITY_DN7168_c0_g1_i1.p1  ORF type:complete len:202 (-),score=17.08 TRINITY_DN7168_c0_g1_i1:1099-1704(-)
MDKIIEILNIIRKILEQIRVFRIQQIKLKLINYDLFVNQFSQTICIQQAIPEKIPKNMKRSTVTNIGRLQSLLSQVIKLNDSLQNLCRQFSYNNISPFSVCMHYNLGTTNQINQQKLGISYMMRNFYHFQIVDKSKLICFFFSIYFHEIISSRIFQIKQVFIYILIGILVSVKSDKQIKESYFSFNVSKYIIGFFLRLSKV